MADRDEAFAALLAYYPAVVRLLRRQGFAPADTEDLAQEVFIRVYTNLDDYRGESRWSYLEQVTRRLVANTIRDKHAEKRYPAALSVDLESIVAPAVSEQTARLHAAIDQLEHRLRELVLLQLQGYSYDEIARMARLSVSTVNARLRSARAQLRNLLIESSAIASSKKPLRDDRIHEHVRHHRWEFPDFTASESKHFVDASGQDRDDEFWGLVAHQLRSLNSSVIAMRAAVQRVMSAERSL